MPMKWPRAVMIVRRRRAPVQFSRWRHVRGLLAYPAMVLLQRMEAVAARRHLSPRTVECYQAWVRQFLAFHRGSEGRWRHPREAARARRRGVPDRHRPSTPAQRLQPEPGHERDRLPLLRRTRRGAGGEPLGRDHRRPRPAAAKGADGAECRRGGGADRRDAARVDAPRDDRAALRVRVAAGRVLHAARAGLGLRAGAKSSFDRARATKTAS
jgi:hypothetical protein